MVKDNIIHFKAKYPNIYEFIMFNLLANLATLTNFVVLFIGEKFLFSSFINIGFVWGPFDYSVPNGGLGSFLSFLLSYACAQTVNFIVQRKLVFNSNNKLGKAIIIYIFAVLIVYFICLYVPTLIMGTLINLFGGLALYIANIINIIIQVVIMYPVMKFIIMKKK